MSRRTLLAGAGGLAGAGALGLRTSSSAALPGLIDVHHHISSPGFVKAITERKTGQVPLMTWSVQKSLEDMDRGGVATAVVSISEPGVWNGDRDASRALARECNEFAARLAVDHPGRFAFFAMLPVPDMEGSLAELAYAMDVLKARGVCWLTSVNGQYIGDPAFTPLMNELNRRKAVVYTHPSRAPCCRGLVPNVPEATIELTTDTTRTIASILFNGVAAQNPQIRFIFSHAGGTMPFILGRFQGLAAKPEMKGWMPNGVEPELRKFYYDTAQAYSAPTLAALTRLIPTSQILFGSDYPFVSEKVTAEAVRAGFNPAEFAAIGRGNAQRLLF